MSTVNPLRDSFASRGIFDAEHPQWTKAFLPEIRLQQLDDDHRAWTAVTGTLLTIVSVGVALAMISVLICLA